MMDTLLSKFLVRMKGRRQIAERHGEHKWHETHRHIAALFVICLRENK